MDYICVKINMNRIWLQKSNISNILILDVSTSKNYGVLMIFLFLKKCHTININFMIMIITLSLCHIHFITYFKHQKTPLVFTQHHPSDQRMMPSLFMMRPGPPWCNRERVITCERRFQMISTRRYGGNPSHSFHEVALYSWRITSVVAVPIFEWMIKMDRNFWLFWRETS